MPKLRAEEQLALAQVIYTFSNRPEEKRAARKFGQAIKKFTKRMQRFISPQKKVAEKVEVIDPAELPERERREYETWARSQGIAIERKR